MTSTYHLYKSTPIPWLPQIPDHWELIGFNFLFRDNKEKNKGMKESLVLSLSYGNIIRKQKNENFGLIPESFETYQVLNPGYIVLRLTDLQNDKRSLRVGYVKERGIITSAYTGLVPNKTDSRYYYYFLHYLDIKKHFYSLGGGVRQSSDYNELKKDKLPLPPLPEQTAIANYLDAKTDEINTFIAKKQKLIALLKEQKQAIINELLQDKDGKWEKRKLRHVIKGKLKYGANESGIPFNPDYPRYIRITDFGSDGKLRNDDMLSLLPNIAKGYILKNGDILFARSGGTVGKTFQYRKSDAYGNLSCYAGYLIKAEPNEKIILSDFLYIYTLSGYYEQWKQGIFNKATIENIGADKYSQLLVPVPSIETQKHILSNINTETAKINEAVLHIEKEIELVKELKQSLIAEVVTGKIKVIS